MTVTKSATIIFLFLVTAYPVRVGHAQTTPTPAPGIKITGVEDAIAAEQKKADLIFNKIDSTHDKIETQVVKLASKAEVKTPKIKYVYTTRIDTIYIQHDTCITIAPIKVYRVASPPPAPVKKNKFKRFFRSLFS